MATETFKNCRFILKMQTGALNLARVIYNTHKINILRTSQIEKRLIQDSSDLPRVIDEKRPVAMSGTDRPNKVKR